MEPGTHLNSSLYLGYLVLTPNGKFSIPRLYNSEPYRNTGWKFCEFLPFSASKSPYFIFANKSNIFRSIVARNAESHI